MIDVILGIATASARTIIAEIEIDMNRFPTTGHICS